MNQNTGSRPGLLLALVTGALAVASLFVPVILLILPALFAYLAATKPVGRFLPALVIAVAGTVLLSQWPGSLYTLAIYLPASVVTAILLRKGVGRFETMAVCAAFVALGFYLLLCLPSQLAGNGPVGNMQDQIQEMIDQFRSMPELLLAPGEDPAVMAESISMATAALNDFRLALPVMMPAILCLIGSVGAVLCVPLAAHWSHKANPEKFRPMTRFTQWRMPKEFLWGALLLGVGVGVLAIAKADMLEAVGRAVLVLVLAPLFVQGLGTALFLVDYGTRRKGFTIVLTVLLLILAFSVAVLLFSVVGLAEQLFSLRRRIKEGFDSMNNKK